MPKAQSKTIPASVGGWNGRDPVDQMPPVYALCLENVLPAFDVVSLRKGFRVHSTSMGSGTVPTLAEYAAMDGTRKLIACANGNIYNATTYNAAATSLASGFSVDIWQTVNYRNKLILVNGTDQPKQYDGTSVTDATYTGVTDNDLITVHVYKERLYFIQKNTQSIWYGAAGAITGALTEYDIGRFLKKGGYPVFCGSTSRDTGSGDQDLFIVMSDQGEVLAYGGLYPGDTGWELIGRYYIAKPLGRRAFFNNNSVMAVITEQGTIPINKVIASEGFVAERDAITDNIANPFRQAATLYGSNAGWEGLAYSRGPWVLINVPISAAISEQYVMNSLTGAWCKFTGMNSSCWCVHNEKLYFGGKDGKVYQADYGLNDNDAAIAAKIKFSFNYYGDRERIKRFLGAKPMFTSDNSLNFNFQIDTDFSDQPFMDTITTTGNSGSMWDEATWDVSPWDTGNIHTNDWRALSGVGRCGALKMSGSFKNVAWSMSAVNILYEPGGML